MKDLTRRLLQMDPILAAELIRRGLPTADELKDLLVAAKNLDPSDERNRTIFEERNRTIYLALAEFLKHGPKLPYVDPKHVFLHGPAWAERQAETKLPYVDPGFVPGLAWTDRQVVTKAVVKALLTDREMGRLQKLLALQEGGRRLHDLKVAVEVEIERRRTHGKRGGQNHCANKRG